MHRSARALLLSSVLLAIACTPRSIPQPGPATGVGAVSLASAPDRFLTTGDTRLRYRDIGWGEPIVLLHGLGGRIEAWNGVADSLARDYRVIVLDERGFGESSKFTDPTRYGHFMIEDVVALLDQLRIPRAHVVGHSMGAAIAANLALRYPDRVISASLLAPPMYPDSIAFAHAAEPYATDLEHGAGLTRMIVWLETGTPDSLAARWSSEALATNPPAVVVTVLRSIGGLMIDSAYARRVQTPTLIAVGKGDGLLSQNRWLATWWPQARLLEVPGVGHGALIQRPEVWTAVRTLMRDAKTKG